VHTCLLVLYVCCSSSFQSIKFISFVACSCHCIVREKFIPAAFHTFPPPRQRFAFFSQIFSLCYDLSVLNNINYGYAVDITV
jgi:hypothetical protein